jgi:simple sugar transport system substrate-binding protein
MGQARLGIATIFAFIALLFGTDALFAGPQGESAGRYTMISIPKFKAPWFDRLQIGLKKAGADFGINVSQRAPSLSDEPNEQVRMIEDAINQGNNAILVVPGDSTAIEQALATARTRKIVTITHESPDQVNADFDVEMIDSKAFGKLAFEEMVKAIGSPEGEYAVYVGSFTRPDHNHWADAAIALARQKYPGLRLIGYRFPVSEDQSMARVISLETIAGHPDIKGFLVFGSLGALGAAQAVREKGLIGRVAVIGTVSPSQASSYLKDGSLSVSVVWDPAEAGYAMVYLAKLVLDGRRQIIGPDLDIPTLGKPSSFKGNTLIYDRPLVLTKDNVDDYSGF